jgi:hypothetical protein
VGYFNLTFAICPAKISREKAQNAHVIPAKAGIHFLANREIKKAGSCNQTPGLILTSKFYFLFRKAKPPRVNT